MQLKILNEKLKVVKIKADETVPEIVYQQNFYSITKTEEEISILVKANKLENAVQALKQNGYEFIEE